MKPIKHIHYTFHLEKPSTDTMLSGPTRIAYGMMYPKSEWFSLVLGKEDIHIQVEDWPKIVEAVEELIKSSKE